MYSLKGVPMGTTVTHWCIHR